MRLLCATATLAKVGGIREVNVSGCRIIHSNIGPSFSFSKRVWGNVTKAYSSQVAIRIAEASRSKKASFGNTRIV